MLLRSQGQSCNEDSRWQKDQSLLGTKNRTRSIILQSMSVSLQAQKFWSVVLVNVYSGKKSGNRHICIQLQANHPYLLEALIQDKLSFSGREELALGIYCTYFVPYIALTSSLILHFIPYFALGDRT